MFNSNSIYIVFCTGKYSWYSWDKESKAYIDKEIPLIIDGWNTEELEKQGSSEFFEAYDKNKTKDYFNFLSARLGKYLKYEGASGGAILHHDYLTLWKIQLLGDYKAVVAFDKGKVSIEVKLIERNNKWYIYMFRVGE